MRTLSFRDILLCEELAHIKNEIELLQPDNDNLVKGILKQVGFDTQAVIEYIPSKHRDMQGHSAIGFQAVGEYDLHGSRQFLDTTDRIVVAGMTDVGLALDMAGMQGRKNTYRNSEELEGKSRKKPDDPRYYSEAQLIEMGYTSGDEEDDNDSGEYLESDYEIVLSQIRQLAEIRDAIRSTVQ